MSETLKLRFLCFWISILTTTTTIKTMSQTVSNSKTNYTIGLVSDRAFGLGEGPHWNSVDKKLYFVDLFEGVAATYDDQNKLETLVKLNGTLSAVLPSQNQPGKVVVCANDSVYLIDTVNDKTGQKKTLLGKVDKANVRFNDAKCDASGRLWLGTMALETSPGVLPPEQGALFKLEKNGQLEENVSKVTLSNGICWSHDNTKLYYIDSVKRQIYVFDYNLHTGNTANQTVLVEMNGNKEFIETELPDGMTIDILGNLWVAMFRGSRIVNIDSETGKVLKSITLPTQQITSVCFGGDRLDTLYVTSAKSFLTEQQLKDEPQAGYVFFIKNPSDPNFRGYQPHYNAKL